MTWSIKEINVLITTISLILCMLCTAECTSSIPLSHELDLSYSFSNYVSDFEKIYDPVEYIVREEIFNKNIANMVQHNLLYYEYLNEEFDFKIRNGIPTYAQGLNKFTDQEPNEIFRGFDKNQHPAYASNSHLAVSRRLDGKDLPFTIDEVSDLPKSIDWRAKGVVSKVKNQSACGSCWAFASTEVIESHVAIETGTLLELSVQQLVDCVPNAQHCGGGGGCTGATVELAFDYVINYSGMVAEDSLEYTAEDGTCPLEKKPLFRGSVNDHDNKRIMNTMQQETKKVAGIRDYVVLPTNDYKIVMNAIAKTGPVAISVDAKLWFLYESGVFSNNGSDGENWDIDHAVVLVGYGTDEKTGLDYWLVRNSWGLEWGEEGYIRLLRTEDKICGIDSTPLDGDGCQFDVNGNKLVPEPVEVCGTNGILFDVVVPTGGHLLDV